MKNPRLNLILSITTLVLLLSGIIALTLPGTAAALLPLAAAEPQLLNPGFEDGFYPFGGTGELMIANHWFPFYDPREPNHRPEYKAETTSIGRARVHTGDSAQKLFTTFSIHDGGIYQTIENVTPGHWYTFSAWAYQWSSGQHDPDVSFPDGKCSVLVGINPWGDAAALSRTTVWGREALQLYNQWVRLDVTALAWSDHIVVALRQICQWPVCHNDAYFDDAHLQVADLGPILPPAPTYTPYPTYTPQPACTPCSPDGSACPSIDDIRRTIREQLDCTIIQLTGPICEP